MPGTSPQARFDHRSDVTQIGVVALSLILGRPLLTEETPGQLGDVVASSWANSARGGLEPLPAGLRAWLMRALQLDPKNRFDSAVDAQEELERVLGESDYLAAPSTLEAFLAEYRAANEPVAAVPAPPASAPVNIAPTSSVPAPAVQTVPAAPADDSNEFRHSMPKRDERDVKASERTADAMRHLENAVRHIETVATPHADARDSRLPAAGGLRLERHAAGHANARRQRDPVGADPGRAGLPALGSRR